MSIIPLATMQRMATDPAFYRSQLSIEVSGDVVRYCDAAAGWQEKDFIAMDPAWLRCVGRTKADVTPMRSWLERCRGASKTSDLAIMACWALCFATFPLKLISASGDRDQAKLVRDAIRRLCELNPWLGDVLEIQNWIVRNKLNGSELSVESSDASSAFGKLVDGIALDEISNWAETEQAKQYWYVISSTLMKKKNLICLSICNAPRVDSWQWGLRESVREDANWYFHSLREIPSWITPEQLAEQKRLLPPHIFNRVCLNIPTSGTDTGISPADYEACELLIGPQDRRSREYDVYIAACDLGWRHDRTGLVVLAMNFQHQRIDLAYCESFSPADYGGELPLSVVEAELIDVQRRFDLDQLVFDPREATGLAQRLTDRGLPCARMNLAPANQNEMAKIFLQAFNARRLLLYPHADLRRDILSMEVVDRTVGLKLQAARTSGGHSDLGFSFAMALCAIWTYQGTYTPDEVLVP